MSKQIVFKNAEQFRAELDAAKKRAMDNFERDWGTRDTKIVYAALRAAIPGSASLADAGAKAHAIVTDTIRSTR